MISDSFSLLWSLLAPALLGILVLRRFALQPRQVGLAYPGWVWTCGCLYLALGLFLYQCLGLGPETWWTAPFVLAIPTLLVSRAKFMGRIDSAPTALPWPFLIFVGLLLTLSLISLISAGSLLVIETDEARIWAAKAKLIYLSPGFGNEFASGLQSLPHSDYPLLNPLLQAWMFSQAGEVLHSANRLPVLVFSLALICIAAGAVLRALKPLYVCLLLVLLVDSEVFRVLSQRAYSDLMVATGCLLAFDAWSRWRKSKLEAHAAMASAGMALALWSKNDASLFLLAAILALLVFCIERRSWSSLPRSPWLFLPLGILLLQLIFNAVFGLSNDLLGDNPEGSSLLSLLFSQFGDRIGPIANYILDYGLLSPATQGIFLVFAVALLILPLRCFRGELYLPTATIGLSLLGCLLVYAGSYQNLIWHLDTSAGRLLFQLTPFAFLWLAMLLRRIAPALSA